MYIGIWNIWGMVNPIRHAEVRRFMSSNNLCLVDLLETKVPQSLFDPISSSFLAGWSWVANYDFAPRGRIWVGWNPKFINFEVSAINSQAIHGNLKLLLSGLSCYISVIYGEHSFARRWPLWEGLIQMSPLVRHSA